MDELTMFGKACSWCGGTRVVKIERNGTTLHVDCTRCTNGLEPETDSDREANGQTSFLSGDAA